jgi:YD repeat-containing protein
VSVDVGARTQTVTDPNGVKTTTTTFDDLGDPVSVAVFDGTQTLTTTSSFDVAGRRTDVTDPAGHHQHWAYDESATPANGNLNAYTDAAGRTWGLVGYNTFGQAGQIVDPTGSVYVTNTYQPGTPLLATQQITGQGASTYSYYLNGLVHVATDPGGRSVTYGYNGSGYKTSQADSAGATTTYAPDGAGRDLMITDPAGRTVNYGYNGTGDITSVTDPGAGDTWDYHYNSRDLSYAYTTLEQLAETDNASGEVTFSYDASGNLASQTSCAPQSGHGPCAASDAASAQPTVNLAYTWQPDGQAATLTGPSGRIGYSYDALGRLGGVTDPSNQTFGVGYDAGGRLS